MGKPTAAGSAAAIALNRIRWAGVSASARKRAASDAAKAFWAALTPEQRSAEMKKRAKKRAKRVA